jgi:hypothetical protein
MARIDIQFTFSSLAATRDWLNSDMACAFTRAYAAARQFLNEGPAAEIAALEQSWVAEVSPSGLAAVSLQLSVAGGAGRHMWKSHWPLSI